MKARLDKCMATENEDYMVLHKKMENPTGGRPQIEYILSTDLAKEVAMLEGNKKGKEVRKYFIQVEKEYRKQQEKPMSTTEMMIAQLQKQLEQEKINNQVTQKLSTLDNKIDKVASEIRVSREVLPQTGFMSIDGLSKECGLSNNTIKRILKIVKPYVAYKAKTVKKFVKQMRKSAYPIGKGTFYRCPIVDFKWQNI